MKKLKLKALELGASELLTRAQLKHIIGGDSPSGPACGGEDGCGALYYCDNGTCRQRDESGLGSASGGVSGSGGGTGGSGGGGGGGTGLGCPTSGEVVCWFSSAYFLCMTPTSCSLAHGTPG